MSEATIRAQIASVISGVVNTDQVHSSAVKITSEEDLISSFGYGHDSDGRALIDGWVVFPASYVTKALTATCGFRESTYTFNVYGYRSLIDGTETQMETDVGAIVTALLTPSNFSTLTPSTVVTEVTTQVGPAQLVGVTVWECYATIVVVDYPH